MLNAILILLCLCVIFDSDGAKADENDIQMNIKVFDMQSKTLTISNLLSGQVMSKLAVQITANVNPKLISSNKGRHLSIVDYNDEWLIDLNSQKQTRHKERYATVVTHSGHKFYFVPNNNFKDILMMEEDDDSQKMLTINRSSIPPTAYQSDDNKISWYLRNDGKLVTIDLQNNALSSVKIKCANALWLGKSQQIFCLRSGNASKGFILDKKGHEIRPVQAIKQADLIVGFNPDANIVIIARMSLSWKLSDFLSEYHDIYQYDIAKDEMQLIKKKAVPHGKGYSIGFEL